jgi:hypothetical protein
LKKHIIRIAALLTITIALVFILFPNQTTEQTEPEAEVVTPTPLVIETVDEERVNNPIPGTVTIVTPYQESECWTGLMYINKDGEMMRITLFDAVESTFDDNF